MLSILEVLELIHEVDIHEEHPTLSTRFLKGEYQGLGTLFIENKDYEKNGVSLRVTLNISLGGTYINVAQWIRGKCVEFKLTDYNNSVLLSALNPIFEDHVYL